MVANPSLRDALTSLKKIRPGEDLGAILTVLQRAAGIDGALVETVRVDGPALYISDSPIGLPEGFASEILWTMPQAMDEGIEDVSLRLALGMQAGELIRDVDFGTGKLLSEYPLYSTARSHGIGAVNILKLQNGGASTRQEHESLFLYREIGRRQVDADEIRILRLLAPALRAAVRRSALPLSAGTWTSELIASERWAALVFSPRRSLVQANDQAIRLLTDYRRVERRDLHATLESLLQECLLRPALHVVGRRHQARLLAECIVADDAIAILLEEHLSAPVAPPMDELSPREREVAEALAMQPLSTFSIAAALRISLSTLRKHTERVYRKLNVHSRLELRMLWLRGKNSR